MKKARDLRKSFHQFYKNLQLPDEDKITLQNARRDVRSHLRKHFGEIRFLTQGSFAYRTLIRPNQNPPQRMDLDDGAYFLDIDINKVNPKELLDEVENALGELARPKGWRLENKPCCCRLVIAEDKHIDIPCYGLRGEPLNEVADSTHPATFASLYQDAGIPYLPFIRSGFIFLAHKTEGWIESDPRRVLDWALKCTEDYGKVFLRVCCYMKAWRDNQWEKSPMKSLSIMAMVEQAFVDEKIAQGEIDDDDVVLRTSARMMDYLGGEGGCIRDPSDAFKCLDKDLTDEEKDTIIARLQGLHSDMETVIYDRGMDSKQASEEMRKQFGRWFPQDPSLIIVPAVVAGAVSQTVTVRPKSPWAE